ncbi:hypothetical protein ACV07N_08930 [Roseivirga echinicomitans]
MSEKDHHSIIKTKIKSEIDGYQRFEDVPFVKTLVAQLLKIGLTLQSEDQEGSSNVCFAESQDLRPEFRDSYSATDLLNYIQYALDELEQPDLAHIAYPKSSEEFWKLAVRERR